jgi:O-antigen/teichoic acid export membrane protein
MLHLLRGMVVYGSADVATGVARLVLAAVYTRVLAPAQFGILAVLYVTVTLAVTLVPLGLPSAMLIRFRQGRPEEAAAYRNSVFSVLLVLCVVAGGVCAVVTRLWPVPDVPWQTVLLAVAWAAAGILMYVPTVSLRFKEHVGRYALSRVCQVAVTVLLVWRAYAGGALGVQEIVAAEAAGAACGLLLACMLDRYVPRLVVSGLVPDLLRLGAPLFALSLGHFLVDLSDRYVLVFLLGKEATGYYAVAARVAIAGALVAEAFNSMWLPFFYRIAAAGNVRTQELRRLARTLVILLGTALAAAMVVLPELVRFGWRGSYFFAPAYHGAAVLVAPLLLQYFLKMCYYISTPAINFNERTWRQVGYICLAAAVNVAGNVTVIVLRGDSGMFGTLTLVALMTVVAYGLAMILGMREYRLLYAGAQPGGWFLGAAVAVVFVALVPAAGWVRLVVVAVCAACGWMLIRRGNADESPPVR